MKPRHFLNRIHNELLVEAIRLAEQQTSGEIRIFVSRRFVDDPVAAAKRQFHRLHMHRTRLRNGVLLLVAPRSQTFAILGDSGIHQHVGDELWRQITDEVAAFFRTGQFTKGLLHAVRRTGDLLRQHFPRQDDDHNELPDEIAQ